MIANIMIEALNVNILNIVNPLKKTKNKFKPRNVRYEVEFWKALYFDNLKVLYNLVLASKVQRSKKETKIFLLIIRLI